MQPNKKIEKKLINDSIAVIYLVKANLFKTKILRLRNVSAYLRSSF